MDVEVASTLEEDYEYYMSTFKSTSVIAGFEDIQDQVDEANLKWEVSRVPRWDPNSDDSLTAFANFFAYIGSHVIVGTTYGARFSLVRTLAP